MPFARLQRLPAFGALLLALACGGNGGGGGTTEPPGPPTQLAISGGNGQDWYFNNPLPTPYSVTVRDASNRAVPGVSVDWAITTGGGTLSADPSTTNSSGVATTTHTLGTATTYVVTASASGVATSATFTANASAPPTSVDVEVRTTGPNNGVFSPPDVVVQLNGTVTWTWSPGIAHNVTYTSGPTPRPSDSPTQTSPSTHSNTITIVGRYAYVCTLHSGMDGTVTVVN